MRKFLIIVLIVVMTSCEPAPPVPALTLQKAWVRAMPPGSYMTAAYGDFTNNSSEKIGISRFESNRYAQVSLHLTKTEQGISTMLPVPVLALEPGAQVSLAPGGLHLMLMNPTQQLATGDRVVLKLSTDSGESYAFSVSIESR